MQRSIYLARLIGPPFVVAGLGMMFNGDAYRALALQFVASPALIYLSGIIVLPAGIAIVLAHNLWVRDWRVIITVFGWLAVIGGTIRILVPQLAQTLGGPVFDWPYTLLVAGGAVAVLGCVLSYYGFCDTENGFNGVKAADAKAEDAKDADVKDAPRRNARKRGGKSTKK